MDELQMLYENNEKFKRYVDRYSRDNKILPAQAITHEIVKQYAKSVDDVNNKPDWVLGK